MSQKLGQRLSPVARASSGGIVARVGDHHRLRIQGCARSMHSERVPVGTLNLNALRASQYCCASESASLFSKSGFVPVRTALAVARGSSAQTYPTSKEASSAPGSAFMSGSCAHRCLAGSYNVLVRSPGINTGMGDQTKVGRICLSRQWDQHVTGSLGSLLAVDM